MIHGRVDIGIYGWKVYLYIFENPADVAIYKKLAKYKTGDQSDTDEVLNEISKGYNDGGITVSYNNRTTHILIHPSKNELKMLNIILHEKRHAEDFIFQYLNINCNEAKAYLSGFLGEELFKIAFKGVSLKKQ